MTPDLQVSRKCAKTSRNLGNLSDFVFQQEILIFGVSKKNRPTNITRCGVKIKNVISQLKIMENFCYSRTPLIRPPSESHWCGRIRGMVAREGFVYEQKPLSVTRNVVV